MSFRLPATLRTARLRWGVALGVVVPWAPAANDPPPPAPVAAKPLFRDPVFDGAADPIVVWHPQKQRWWMFYTNRRANVPGLSGVAWVHGTRIGIAESADGGATWRRLGDAEIELPIEVGGREPTHWAPDIVTGRDGTYHMYLTVVPGVFENWQHPRHLVHLTSVDLWKWTYVSTLRLSADRVIDACVAEMPGGGWRLWYNNERDGKSIYHADSRDLRTWTDRGKVTSLRARGEGPFVFTWRGWHWMLVDTWRGLGVYRSLDLERWEQQPGLLLDRPGRGPDDGVNGGHPGVVVSGGRAYCFYFTHPGRAGTISPQDKDSLELRRSSIHGVELFEQDGWLACDRDAPLRIALEPPGAPRPAETPAPLVRSPADAARLRLLGSRDIRAHDPSTLVQDGGEYWMFHTGRGVGSWRSRDLLTWREGPRAFAAAPAWVAEAVPENRDAQFWAPDVIKVGGRYLLYYSVSSFGRKTSAIALATNATLNPESPRFGWRDEGIVIRSGAATNFNAIDPALMCDREGRLWMSFGSYWSGLKLVELDPATGKLLRPEAPPQALAHDRSIEAAFIHQRGDEFFLFASYGWCCRGINSTYHIRVGRSAAITGPYRDREGRRMLEGGGTLVLASEGPFIGPGHPSIMTIDGREWFGCHFYDATQRGRPAYALRPLTWDTEGWPVVGRLE
jgi:hypothetical protein